MNKFEHGLLSGAGVFNGIKCVASDCLMQEIHGDRTAEFGRVNLVSERTIRIINLVCLTRPNIRPSHLVFRKRASFV